MLSFLGGGGVRHTFVSIIICYFNNYIDNNYTSCLKIIEHSLSIHLSRVYPLKTTLSGVPLSSTLSPLGRSTAKDW